MKVAKDITGLSLPFAAGIAAGSLISGALAPRGPLLWLLSGGALVVCAFLLGRAMSRKTDSWRRLLLLYLASGFFCSSAAFLGSPAESVRKDPVRAAALNSAEKMKELIAAIPYSDPSTAPLVTALTTGDRSGLSKAVVKTFRESGASHILALSGLHLGIIYVLLLWGTAFMGHSPAARKLRFGAVVSLSWFYALATGSSPSIVRAVLFISFNEIARLRNLKQEPLRVLCSALTLQLAFDPLQISSVGFQLSYLAMTGIFILFPKMKAWYPDEEKGSILHIFNLPRRIWNMASLGISCQVFTAPLAWYYFGTFPEYFLLTNLIAMPLTSILMTLSIMTILLRWLGICPAVMVFLNEKAAIALQGVLAVISSM